MWSINYHYIIVGGGLAGLQLALELKKDLFFKGKSIAIIDPDPKIVNDKTWCFWEKGDGKWDHLLTKKWNRGRFVSSRFEKNFHLEPYSYKMLRSMDFYKEARKELEGSGNFSFIKDEISSIDPVRMAALGAKNSYTASHFFDSRVNGEFKNDNKSTKILQHFKGYMIQSQSPIFDPSGFTMMDYRSKYNNSTSFTYILPLSANKALIEYTFFTPFLVEEEVYDEQLSKYLKTILKLENYEITETEKGVIPMTDFPFHDASTEKITKIGTGGSWVKSSTGYSFKSTEKKVKQILENIKAGEIPSKNLIKNRFRFYDSIFLDVLKERNELGEKIFTSFYRKNSPQQIFRFLDEETEVKEELSIMLSMFHPQFLKSFFKKILQKK